MDVQHVVARLLRGPGTLSRPTPCLPVTVPPSSVARANERISTLARSTPRKASATYSLAVRELVREFKAAVVSHRG